jgi:hypothetical protein
VSTSSLTPRSRRSRSLPTAPLRCGTARGEACLRGAVPQQLEPLRAGDQRHPGWDPRSRCERCRRRAPARRWRCRPRVSRRSRSRGPRPELPSQAGPPTGTEVCPTRSGDGRAEREPLGYLTSRSDLPIPQEPREATPERPAPATKSTRSPAGTLAATSARSSTRHERSSREAHAGHHDQRHVLVGAGGALAAPAGAAVKAKPLSTVNVCVSKTSSVVSLSAAAPRRSEGHRHVRAAQRCGSWRHRRDGCRRRLGPGRCRRGPRSQGRHGCDRSGGSRHRQRRHPAAQLERGDWHSDFQPDRVTVSLAPRRRRSPAPRRTTALRRAPSVRRAAVRDDQPAAPASR